MILHSNVKLQSSSYAVFNIIIILNTPMQTIYDTIKKPKKLREDHKTGKLFYNNSNYVISQ